MKIALQLLILMFVCFFGYCWGHDDAHQEYEDRICTKR